MHCASCATIISKKIEVLNGVKSINVNTASDNASLEFDEQKISIEKMNSEIEKLGYSFSDQDQDKKRELLKMKHKVQFVLPVAVLVFIAMMWNILSEVLPAGSVSALPVPMSIFNIVTLILSTIVLFWVGQPFLKGVIRFIEYRVANMDTLIGIGTLTAYIYSVFVTLFPQTATLLLSLIHI